MAHVNTHTYTHTQTDTHTNRHADTQTHTDRAADWFNLIPYSVCRARDCVMNYINKTNCDV